MARRNKQKQKQPPQGSYKDMPSALGASTSRANCDQFSNSRGNTDSVEWYGDWPQLQSLVTNQLLYPSSLLPQSDAREAPSDVQPAELSILVPTCGSTELYDYLYGAGFKGVVNVNFSEMVTVGAWFASSERGCRVFPDKSFDAIVDNRVLDALMLGYTPSLYSYIHKVKRILKVGGKYICLTLPESSVLGILFSNFLYGWKMSVYTISKEPSSENQGLQTLMVVTEKDIRASLSEISFLDENGGQVHELRKEFKIVQEFRSKSSKGCNKVYSLEELDLEDLIEIEPGRSKKLIVGDPGGPYICESVLFDAQQGSERHFGVLLISRNRVDEWLFSSEVGREQVAAKLEAGRLLIIILDPSNYLISDEHLERELYPLARQLAPRDWDVRIGFPVRIIYDVIKQRTIIHEYTDALMGEIIVEDVIYYKFLNDDLVFRRLTFKISVGVVESEALLHKVQKASKTKKKGKQKKGSEGTIYVNPGLGTFYIPEISGSHKSSSVEWKVDHDYLAQLYQNAIIFGLLLIFPHLMVSSSSTRARVTSSTRAMVNTVVIGLGGGLLPMFMNKWLPDLNIVVVELIPTVLDVAKDCFDFEARETLQVHIRDGIDFVREKAEGESKIDILIVDVNFPDSRQYSSGLTSPSESPAFVEESFLQNAKNSLSEKGLFVINVICWSSTSRAQIYSSLKKVFGKVLQFKGDDDAQEVIFALKNESQIMTEDDLSEACRRVERSLEKVENPKWFEGVVKASTMIRPLR